VHRQEAGERRCPWAIVIIRTILSFSLEIEIDVRLPWRRGQGKTGEAAAGG
jgi:hypothetical protein